MGIANETKESRKTNQKNPICVHQSEKAKVDLIPCKSLLYFLFEVDYFWILCNKKVLDYLFCENNKCVICHLNIKKHLKTVATIILEHFLYAIYYNGFIDIILLYFYPLVNC